MKWFLTITAAIAMAASMAFGYLGFNLLLFAGLFASLGFLVAANLDRLSEFKASSSGIEARTRDVVNRAEGAIAELRILALHMAEVSLSLAMRTGRWGGFSDDELEKLKSSVDSNLERLGIAEGQRNLVLKDWHRIVEFDYAHHILGGSRIPEGRNPEMMKDWNELRDGGFKSIPMPDVLEEFLKKHDFYSAALADYIEDYRYYFKNHQHRRPQVWRERENWGHLGKKA
jgi:hypothetical protein